MKRRTCEALITGLSTDGRGVARIHSGAVFMSGGLPGDRVLVLMDGETAPPSARILRVIEPSPDRIPHPCPHAGECGLSPWGSLRYDRQLAEKTILVDRTLSKMVGPVEVLPAVASPLIWKYRNRLSLTVWPESGGHSLGYQIRPRSQEGVGISLCMLASQPVQSALASVSAFLQTENLPAQLSVPRRIQLHETAAGAGALLIFAGPLPSQHGRAWIDMTAHFLPGGVWLASGNAAGILKAHSRLEASADALPMKTNWDGRSLDLHVSSFCQANPASANLVIQWLRGWAAEQSFSAVWDLYGGFGALGFAAAGPSVSLTVIENSPHGQSAFGALAAALGHPRAQHLVGDVLRELPRHVKTMKADDLVILDPPRSGVHSDVLRMLGKSRVRKLAYLSCNPARLGRDLRLLIGYGFRLMRIQPYDFFPNTPAMEVLCCLERK